jgi:hypothetical protein
VSGHEFIRAERDRKQTPSALPKAGAEVPLLDRSALKEGHSNAEIALAYQDWRDGLSDFAPYHAQGRSPWFLATG